MQQGHAFNVTPRACISKVNTIHEKIPLKKFMKKASQAAANSVLGSALISMVMDSGCTYHCHPHRSDLINFKPRVENMFSADGASCPVTGMGDLPVVCKDKAGKMHKVLIVNVRCVPSFTETLLSVDQFYQDSGTEVRFAGYNHVHLPRDAQGQPELFFDFERTHGLFRWAVIAGMRAKGTLTNADLQHARAFLSSASEAIQETEMDYDVTIEHSSKIDQIHGARTHSHIGAASGDAAVEALQRRLHVGQDLIRRLPDVTSDAPSNLKSGRVHSCASSMEANATRLSHKHDRYTPSYVGRLVHADIVGPFKRSLHGSHQYLLVLVDDHSRFISLQFLTHKSKAPEAIRKFVASLNALVNLNVAEPKQIVGTLQTDNAGEFLSKEFTEFLDSELIHHTTCPPHVHALNGVAERAIRAVVENMRSTIVAGNVPIVFWDYVASHSADVLNRTGGPPGSTKSAYELVTGAKPKVMGIWPVGCRAFSVKPRSAYSKTMIEAHSWPGINLGRVPETPGAYYIWVSQQHKVVENSDVHFDETLMPWRAKGEQRVGVAPPHRALPDGQPPGLPVAPPTVSKPKVATSSLAEAYDQVVKSPAATARASRTVLLLFSGPKRRPDGLAAFLLRLGYDAVLVDNDPVLGGGAREDILHDRVYQSLMARVRAGEFLAIIAAPPCGTFSISRFVTPKGGKVGPKPVRSRKHIRQLPGLDAKGEQAASQANEIVRRTAALLIAGHLVGTSFMVENPADRGDASQSDIFLHEEHGPLWHMPEMIAIKRLASCNLVTFPMCSFGSPWQKFTSLMFSAGFDAWLHPLGALRCHHHRHASMAGGEYDEGEWNSAQTAAYPPEFNYYLARCVHGLADSSITPPVFHQEPGGRGAEPSHEATKSTAAPVGIPTPDTASVADARPSTALSPMRTINFDAADAPPSPTSPPAPESPHAASKRQPKVWAGRVGGAPRQTRSARPELAVGGSKALEINMLPKALMCVGGQWRLAHPSGRAMLAKPDPSVDPRNRAEAMRMDAEGWTKSELDELTNHEGISWIRVDRSVFERTKRKLVKTVWVYKVKRSGKLKSRLCVQGCSQIPGVDYDQTHCSTMRAPTLRLLSSVASRLNLKMRRWDFVAAYLQGELLDGEEIYCHAPAGHATIGADGKEQVLRVIKPIYGMSQAGRRWQRSLYPWMNEWTTGGAKFTQAHADSNTFICRTTTTTPAGPRDETLIVGVYVDDCFVLYSHDDQHSLYQRFTADLQSRWKVDDEGDVSDLLGIEIESASDGCVTLKQRGYIERLCQTWFPDGVHSTVQSNQTPADLMLPQLVADALVLEDEFEAADVKRFQSIVGALLYAATNTRPDVAYAVGMLCRVMSRPTPELHQAALRVLGYLYRTRHLGLRYQADKLPVKGFSDSDWAVKHSTSGFVFMYNQAAISWGSKKQTSVALSSCEAELMAASVAAQEAVHLKGFMEELQLDSGKPIELAVDNTAARDTAYNPEHHQKVKHIERRHFYVRECVEDHKITVPYVNTLDNLSDFFTKPLQSKHFFGMRDAIMNVRPREGDDYVSGGVQFRPTAN